jgi:leucyl-tRNA synthetase
MALNTCISAMMIGMNEIQSAGLFHRQILDPYVRMLAPFAPHLAEELWAVLGHEPSVHHAPYPNWESIYLEQDTYLYPVQHNGKVRLQVELPAKGLPEDLVQLALAHPKVVEWLNGRIPTKTIAVPGRIINIVLPNQP